MDTCEPDIAIIATSAFSEARNASISVEIVALDTPNVEDLSFACGQAYLADSSGLSKFMANCNVKYTDREGNPRYTLAEVLKSQEFISQVSNAFKPLGPQVLDFVVQNQAAEPQVSSEFVMILEIPYWGGNFIATDVSAGLSVTAYAIPDDLRFTCNKRVVILGSPVNCIIRPKRMSFFSYSLEKNLTEAQLYASRAVDRDWYLDMISAVRQPAMARGYRLRMERHRSVFPQSTVEKQTR